MKELKEKTNQETPPEKTDEVITPTQAILRLIEGNYRFINNEKVERCSMSEVRKTSAGQKPFAAILSCIDSRVPAEIIFDQGIGDLFSIRIAGNIVNEDILGSLEYACKVSGSKIIVILGHSKCGAVTAACENVELGNITALLNKIKPAIASVKTKTGENPSLHINKVVHQNILNSHQEILKQSPILAEMVKKNEIVIVGAKYSVDEAKVDFFDL